MLFTSRISKASHILHTSYTTCVYRAPALDLLTSGLAIKVNVQLLEFKRSFHVSHTHFTVTCIDNVRRDTKRAGWIHVYANKRGGGKLSLLMFSFSSAPLCLFDSTPVLGRPLYFSLLRLSRLSTYTRICWRIAYRYIKRKYMYAYFDTRYALSL